MTIEEKRERAKIYVIGSEFIHASYYGIALLKVVSIKEDDPFFVPKGEVSDICVSCINMVNGEPDTINIGSIGDDHCYPKDFFYNCIKI